MSRSAGLVDTAAHSSLSHDESDTAFCLLGQNSKSPPLWTSIPPLTERLSSRFAAQSLSVYATMWSDRTPPSVVRSSDRSLDQKSPHSLEHDHVRIFRAQCVTSRDRCSAANVWAIHCQVIQLLATSLRHSVASRRLKARESLSILPDSQSLGCLQIWLLRDPVPQ